MAVHTIPVAHAEENGRKKERNQKEGRTGELGRARRNAVERILTLVVAVDDGEHVWFHSPVEKAGRKFSRYK